MKICQTCGAKNDEWKANCIMCKAPFVEGVDPSAQEARAADNEMGVSERPTGEAITRIGGSALVFGLLALSFGWFLPASEYSIQDIDPDRLQLKSNLMAVGAVVTNLGALAYFAGKIINAISYLPGRCER